MKIFTKSLLTAALVAGAFSFNATAQELPEPTIFSPVMGVSSFSTITVTWGYQALQEGPKENRMLTITTPSGDEFTALAYGEYSDEEDKGGTLDNSGFLPDNSLTVSYYKVLSGEEEYQDAPWFTQHGVYTLHIPEGAVTIDGVPNPEAEVTYNLGYIAYMEEATYVFTEENGFINVALSWDNQEVRATRAANSGFGGFVTDLSDEETTELFSNSFKLNDEKTVLNVTLGKLAEGSYSFTFPGYQLRNSADEVNPDQTITFTVPLEEASVEFISIDSDVEVYNINGVKVNANRVNQLQKGLYIINGKKVVVK